MKSRLSAALPMIGRDDWCHIECWARWEQLDREVQSVLGGHIHFTGDGWVVPESGPPPIMEDESAGWDVKLTIEGDRQ